MAKIAVKFVFANSNATVDSKVSRTSSGMDLKLLLMTQWPKALTKCNDPNRVRLICLGRVIEDDDELLGGKGAASSKFLRSDSTLPINVVVRPEGVKPSTSPRSQPGPQAGSRTDSQLPATAPEKSTDNSGSKKPKNKANPIERDTLGNTPALQEVCQCVVC